MGAILEKTINRAVSKGWIPQGEKELVIKRIEQLASKYQFSVDDYAMASIIESGGFNPKASNGSFFGINQWGQDVLSPSELNITPSQILSKSVLQQLEIADKYFGIRVAQNLFPKQGADLASLYLTILYPAYAKETDFNKTIPAGRQAAILHEGENSSNRLTKNSIIAGLRKHASRVLGEPIGNSSPTPPGVLPGDYASQPNINGGGIGLISAVFTSNCTEPFPVDYTIAEAITYAGCKIKVASAQLGGAGFGNGATAMGVLGTAPTGGGLLSEPALDVPLKPGSFIWPFKKRPIFNSSGAWCEPRSSHYHAGIDFDTPMNTAILASADGVVLKTGFDSGGYGNYIDLKHGALNNFVTRYAHLNSILTKASGTPVKQGQIIAYSGNTGNNVVHLHFEIRKDGGGFSSKNLSQCQINTVNPRNYCT